jgi:hypothetical protein
MEAAIGLYMQRVVIGMDPHKRSATIAIIDERERVLTQGRFGTDTDGYQQMLAAGREFPSRTWAGLLVDSPRGLVWTSSLAVRVDHAAALTVTRGSRSQIHSYDR